MKTMMTVQEASERILAGKHLLVSGEECLLRALPRGSWIGGTIPYFMAEDGGLCTRERVQVTELPDLIESATVKFYDVDELESIPADYKSNGFSCVLIPAFTAAHQKFAKECSMWRGIFDRPLIGWVAGVHLDEVGSTSPQVFNGQSGEASATKAVVMHVQLPKHIYAKAHIINVFQQRVGDTITFDKAGFSVAECQVNGQKQSFVSYMRKNGIDATTPLVADYCGASINVSVQKLDVRSSTVDFYAPVFPGVEYKFAVPVADYELEFRRHLEGAGIKAIFSCNCILNYLYAELEGKKTGDMLGPMTFGEIAYMLLNQTLVYLTLETA